MTYENLLKAKERYEKSGDEKQLNKVLKNLKIYKKEEPNILDKVAADKKAKK